MCRKLGKDDLKARFAGKCDECGAEIRRGKEISKNSGGKWVHAACSDQQEELL